MRSAFVLQSVDVFEKRIRQVLTGLLCMSFCTVADGPSHNAP